MKNPFGKHEISTRNPAGGIGGDGSEFGAPGLGEMFHDRTTLFLPDAADVAKAI